MATTEEFPVNSALRRRFLQNSTALAESRPRVELSQHCRGALASAASEMVTRLRLGQLVRQQTYSPPDTPRMKSFPTMVFKVWLIPKTDMMTSRLCSANCLRVMPAGGSRGARASAAKASVSPTVMVGRWTSTSAV